MAKFNRQILIPFLRDVCSAELLIQKLNRDIQNNEIAIKQYQNYLQQPLPNPEPPKPDYLMLVLFAFYCGVLIAEALILSYLYNNYVIDYTIVVGAVFAWIDVWQFPSFIGSFAGVLTINSDYQAKLANYHSVLAKNQSIRDSFPAYTQQLHDIQQHALELNAMYAEAMRNKTNLYALNIIPTQYRTIHCAYYLYEFFNSCQEDDLGAVLQTMLLDKITQQMDTVIAQNEEIILNQRVAIAHEEERNEEQRNYHRAQMRHMASMESNQELQNDYLRMIETNQEMTNLILMYDAMSKN